MPLTNQRGYGMSTVDKEDGYECIVKQQLSIVKQAVKRATYPWRYRLIDCCSGHGENPECNCSGSPVIFLEVAEKIGVPYEAYFIDNDPDTIAALKRRLSLFNLTVGKYTVMCADYNDVLHKIVSSSGSEMNFGLIYVDPTNLPNWITLENISNYYQCRAMDILIHVSATNQKRVNKSPKTQQYYDSIDGYVTKIKKEFWMIREPLYGDRHKHIFLFGTNYRNMKAMNSCRYYDIASERGKRIIAQQSMNREEFKNSSIGKETLDGWFK